MKNRLTLLIPGRARCQVIKVAGEPGYFRTLKVKPSYRRRGYGFELIIFALRYAKEFLEMDIRYQSTVAQRLAARLGYRQIGPSERFIGCRLWRHGGRKTRLPRSRLSVLNVVPYERADGKTTVIYLSAPFES